MEDEEPDEHNDPMEESSDAFTSSEEECWLLLEIQQRCLLEQEWF